MLIKLLKLLWDREPGERRTPKAQVVPGEMNAPWEEFPGAPACSRRWQQSYWEVYYWQWSNWYTGLTEDERRAYQNRHIEPEAWRDGDFYGRWDKAIVMQTHVWP